MLSGWWFWPAYVRVLPAVWYGSGSELSGGLLLVGALAMARRGTRVLDALFRSKSLENPSTPITRGEYCTGQRSIAADWSCQ